MPARRAAALAALATVVSGAGLHLGGQAPARLSAFLAAVLGGLGMAHSLLRVIGVPPPVVLAFVVLPATVSALSSCSTASSSCDRGGGRRCSGCRRRRWATNTWRP